MAFIGFKYKFKIHTLLDCPFYKQFPKLLFTIFVNNEKKCYQIKFLELKMVVNENCDKQNI